MGFVITSFLALISIILYTYKKLFCYWSDLGVIQYPVSIPHGNIKGMGKDYCNAEMLIKFYQLTKRHGAPFCGLYLGLQPVLLVVDLDLVKTILIKDSNVFLNRGHYYNEKDDPLSAHLFSLEDDSWRTLRAKLSPIFTSGKLKMMLPIIYDVANNLTLAIDKIVKVSEQLDVRSAFGRYVVDMIGAVAFGIECDSLAEEKNTKFFEMTGKIFISRRSALVRALRNYFKNLARKLHVKAIAPEAAEFFMETVKALVQYRRNNPQVDRQDFIKLLIIMMDEGKLTIEQVAAQSLLFFIGGFDGAAGTMAFCVYELSIDEEVQEKARNCVQDSIRKHGGLTYHSLLDDMKYLDLCINETLRKYPQPDIFRVAGTDYLIPNTNVVIPKGQAVTIPLQAIHNDHRIYPQPEKFVPERFLPEQIAKRPPMSFIPFGEGPRTCIGVRFGMLETKLGLAKFLLHYKFSLDRTKTSVPLKMQPAQFNLTPTERIIVNIEKIYP